MSLCLAAVAQCDDLSGLVIEQRRLLHSVGLFLVLNAFIGVLEWLVLQALMGSRRHAGVQSLGVVVGGNYFSAVTGLAFLTLVWPVVAYSSPAAVLCAPGTAVAPVCAGLFLLSILSEWPFAHIAVYVQSRRQVRSVWYSLIMTVAMNVASYALLVPVLLERAPVTRGTRFEMASPVSVAGGLGATVYYAANAHEVCTVRLDGTGQWVVKRIPSREITRLVLFRDWESGILDLDGFSYGLEMPALLRSVGYAPVFPRERRSYRPRYDWSDYGVVTDLGDVDEEPSATIDTRERFDDEDEIMSVTVSSASGEVHIASGTSFMPAKIRACTLLPNHLMVAQLTTSRGWWEGEIVLFDLKRLRLAVLAKGGNPVVVLDKAPPGASWARAGEEPPRGAAERARRRQDRMSLPFVP